MTLSVPEGDRNQRLHSLSRTEGGLPPRLENNPARLPPVETASDKPETPNNPAAAGDTVPIAMLAHFPGMVYRCQHDANRTMTFASEGSLELLGFRPVELVQNQVVSFIQLVMPQDRESVWRELNTAIQSQRAYDLTYRILTRKGDEKWVRETGRGIYDNHGSLHTLEGFLTDVTPLRRSEQRLKRQIDRFESLRKIDIAITASFDLRVTLGILLEQVISNLGADAADVLLYNPTGRTLNYAAGKGFRTNALQHTRLQIGEGFAGIAALQRRIVRVPDLQRSLGELRRSARISAEGFYSYFCVPLLVKNQIKGVLEVFHRSLFNPDNEWMTFLEALAGQAAIAIDNANLFDDLQRSNTELGLAYESTLEGWSRALELRDQETEGHTQRVADLTVRLAQNLGIEGEELQHIRRGALLHDIGKMGIPDNILRKPGPLSPEEWQIMRQHPVYALRLLSPILNLRASLDIPYCHHERWDGSGYPRQLRGEEIPFSARIFAVIDVWDALLSDRPYRPAWAREQAIEYLRRESGRHFDPKIVEVFLKMI